MEVHFKAEISLCDTCINILSGFILQDRQLFWPVNSKLKQPLLELGSYFDFSVDSLEAITCQLYFHDDHRGKTTPLM